MFAHNVTKVADLFFHCDAH